MVTGTSPDGKLVEVIELRDHPWFLAVQCHPEFKSKPTKAHPLFRSFIQAGLARREARKPEGSRNRPQDANGETSRGRQPRSAHSAIEDNLRRQTPPARQS